MSPAAQGSGYATEAVTALVTYAFETLRADVVRIYANEANVPVNSGWLRRPAST